MPSPLSINIKNDLNSLSEALRELTLYLKGHNLEPHDIDRVELVLEELLSNTIKYGYKDNLEHLIHLIINPLEQKLQIEITDDAHPFDPRKKPTQEAFSPIEARKIGGLGLLLVNKFTDKIDYNPTPNGNHYTLTLLRND